MQTLEERILNSIIKDNNGCWLWQRRKSSNGYGQMWMKTSYQHGVTGLAHRISYQAFKGAIPDGLHIDHLCKVRACVNPDHLEAVTPQENVHRSNAKYKQQQARTHCLRGHEYSASNTFTAKTRYGGISRSCKACDYARHKAKRMEMTV